MPDAGILEPPVTQFTDIQIDAAITTFRHYFPEDASLAGVSNDEIRARVQTYLEAKQPLAFKPVFAAPHPSALRAGGIEDCACSIATVVVDCIFVMINLAGLHPPETVARAAVVPVARTVVADLPGWRRLTSALVEARTAQEKAAALYNIGSTAWNVGMFRGIWASIQDSMTWWDWVITGVTAVASVAAIFLTGGAAFVAQLALSVASFAFAISDAAKIPDACIGH